MTSRYDVSFDKYVNVNENVDVDKSFDIRAYVSGNSAMALRRIVATRRSTPSPRSNPY